MVRILGKDSLMSLPVNTNSTALFLSRLFARLNEEKITYCVLRNYEDLPEKVGNDVDTWVDKRHWLKFFTIVKELASTLDYTLDYTPRLSVKGEGDYFLLKEINGQIEVIHLDCWAYFHWKGVCFIDETVIPENLRWHEKGFYVPAKGIEASINLLKDLIYHRMVKDKYKDLIKTYAQQDPEVFKKSLLRPFGFKITQFILENAKSGNWEALESNTNKLRTILFIRCLLNSLSQTGKWYYYIKAQIRRFFINPRGVFIVFIGPDGSGKSTTTRRLLESEFAKKLFQKKHYFHGHFPYLPELKRIAEICRIKKKEAPSNDIPENQIKPFSLIRSVVYPVYYGFNYFLGHLFIWKEKARAGLIVFDRYFFDYFIQKQFENCPRWLLHVISKIIPKPDILIYLKNDPEVIHSRKPELSVGEIERQLEMCDEVTTYSKNSFIIRTSISPEEVVKKIQQIIIDRIKEKQKVRI